MPLRRCGEVEVGWHDDIYIFTVYIYINCKLPWVLIEIGWHDALRASMSLWVIFFMIFYWSSSYVWLLKHGLGVEVAREGVAVFLGANSHVSFFSYEIVTYDFNDNWLINGNVLYNSWLEMSLHFMWFYNIYDWLCWSILLHIVFRYRNAQQKTTRFFFDMFFWPQGNWTQHYMYHHGRPKGHGAVDYVFLTRTCTSLKFNIAREKWWLEVGRLLSFFGTMNFQGLC